MGGKLTLRLHASCPEGISFGRHFQALGHAGYKVAELRLQAMIQTKFGMLRNATAAESARKI